MVTNDGESPTDSRTPRIDLGSKIELGFNSVGRWMLEYRFPRMAPQYRG